MCGLESSNQRSDFSYALWLSLTGCCAVCIRMGVGNLQFLDMMDSVAQENFDWQFDLFPTTKSFGIRETLFFQSDLLRLPDSFLAPRFVLGRKNAENWNGTCSFQAGLKISSRLPTSNAGLTFLITIQCWPCLTYLCLMSSFLPFSCVRPAFSRMRNFSAQVRPMIPTQTVEWTCWPIMSSRVQRILAI